MQMVAGLNQITTFENADLMHTDMFKLTGQRLLGDPPLYAGTPAQKGGKRGPSKQ